MDTDTEKLDFEIFLFESQDLMEQGCSRSSKRKVLRRGHLLDFVSLFDEYR